MKQTYKLTIVTTVSLAIISIMGAIGLGFGTMMLLSAFALMGVESDPVLVITGATIIGGVTVMTSIYPVMVAVVGWVEGIDLADTPIEKR